MKAIQKGAFSIHPHLITMIIMIIQPIHLCAALMALLLYHVMVRQNVLMEVMKNQNCAVSNHSIQYNYRVVQKQQM